jgi:hypothetical protein
MSVTCFFLVIAAQKKGAEILDLFVGLKYVWVREAMEDN